MFAKIKFSKYTKPIILKRTNFKMRSQKALYKTSFQKQMTKNFPKSKVNLLHHCDSMNHTKRNSKSMSEIISKKKNSRV